MNNLDTVYIILLSVFAQLNWITAAPLDAGSGRSIVPASEKVIATINHENIKIVWKNEQIENMIGAAGDSIKNSLDDLVQFIKETKIHAIDYGVNINSCLSRTIIIDKIGVNEIQKCSFQEELRDLEEELFEIGNRSIALVKQVEDNSNDDTDTTLNSAMDDIENELPILQAKIEEVLSEAYSSALHCTEAHLASLDQQINLISIDFTSCLDAFEEL